MDVYSAYTCSRYGSIGLVCPGSGAEVDDFLFHLACVKDHLAGKAPSGFVGLDLVRRLFCVPSAANRCGIQPALDLLPVLYDVPVLHVESD